jgi:hypothetical protein
VAVRPDRLGRAVRVNGPAVRHRPTVASPDQARPQA